MNNHWLFTGNGRRGGERKGGGRQKVPGGGERHTKVRKTYYIYHTIAFNALDKAAYKNTWSPGIH